MTPGFGIDHNVMLFRPLGYEPNALCHEVTIVVTLGSQCNTPPSRSSSSCPSDARQHDSPGRTDRPETMPLQIASHQPPKPLRHPMVVLHDIVTTEDAQKRVQRASSTAMHHENEGICAATVTADGLQTAVVDLDARPRGLQPLFQGAGPVPWQRPPKTVHDDALFLLLLCIVSSVGPQSNLVTAGSIVRVHVDNVPLKTV